MNSRPWSVMIARGREEIPSGALEAILASYRKSVFAGCIPNNLFDAVLGETFRQLFDRGAVAHIAVNPADQSHWLGLLISERTADGVPVVHGCFVKPLYRNSPVADSLFEAAGIDRASKLFFTLRTGPESKLYPNGRHAPEVARRLKA